MANEEQLAILKHGVEVWNMWREKNEDIPVDLTDEDLSGVDLRGIDFNRAILTDADLSEVDLRGADLRRANLRRVFFRGADLSAADLRGAFLNKADLGGTDLRTANLRGADLSETFLVEADLSEADLRVSDLWKADLWGADLRGSDLSGANLNYAQIVETKLQDANLTNCRVFGISSWNGDLKGATQSNLIITDAGEPEITVDNLEIAQFIYLLIHNQKLRNVIDTIGKKAVLILGRFTDERKAVLEAIREELRKKDYIPILFDFEKPESKDVTETIGLLAHMARFVIADLTDAKSIPQELSHIVPDLPSVAVQPLILSGQREYGMFEHWTRYPWVLPIHEYEDQDQLIADLAEKVIAPAEAKVIELRSAK